jgi:hypothetical protein
MRERRRRRWRRVEICAHPLGAPGSDWNDALPAQSMMPSRMAMATASARDDTFQRAKRFFR